MDANVGPVADEREGLLGFLAQQRRVLKAAAFGLTDEQARSTPTDSALSVGGLIKHVAHTERRWTDEVLRRKRDDAVSVNDYMALFRLGEDETLAGALAFYDEVARETEEAIAGIADLGQPVPVPDEPWFPKDIEAWSVRWVLLHMIEETARHAGHADIIREHIDKATAFELLAGAEGWPATPWIKPWRPAGDSEVQPA